MTEATAERLNMENVNGNGSAGTCLITGATGLVGAALVRRFAADGLRVVAAARNPAKAKALFGELPAVEILEWDVTRPLDLGGRAVDWLVHAAGETSSRVFVERPVETIETIVDGTRNALRLARAAGVRAMVFLSTMEVYGVPTAARVSERDYGFLDPLSVRTSYPEAKRLAESLCVAYAKEYGVPVRIARLTQTFGAGVRYDDGRVFAEFARAILEHRDIVLKTEGTTARSYCALADAVEAIRTILASGEDATAYTVANEATFCTIREMAEALVRAHPESGAKVVVDTQGAAARGFAPPFRMNLDCSRLRALGWRPKVGLLEMFEQMMAGMKASAKA